MSNNGNEKENLKQEKTSGQNAQEGAQKERNAEAKEQIFNEGEGHEDAVKLETLSAEELRKLVSFQHDLNKALQEENEELIKKTEELRAMLSKNDTYLDQLVAIKRDFESYKGRIRCDKDQSEEEGKLKAIEKTFPFIDTLEKARVDLKDGKAYELIYRQFCKLLFEMGIEEIDVLNKPFNHDNANAVTTRQVSDAAQKGNVVEVFQKGFRYGSKILRYAQVVVGE